MSPDRSSQRYECRAEIQSGLVLGLTLGLGSSETRSSLLLSVAARKLCDQTTASAAEPGSGSLNLDLRSSKRWNEKVTEDDKVWEHDVKIQVL